MILVRTDHPCLRVGRHTFPMDSSSFCVLSAGWCFGQYCIMSFVWIMSVYSWVFWVLSVRTYLLLWLYNDDAFYCCRIIYSSFRLQILINSALFCEAGMVCLTNLNLGCPFELIWSNSEADPSLSFKGGNYLGLCLLRAGTTQGSVF
jgi:hypothetical protein